MLKKLLLLCLFISSLFSQNILWHSNYDKALIKAHKENKNLFVFLVNGNQASKNILTQLYKEKSLIEKLNQEYISILVNVNYKTTYPIELYYTTSFPTMFLANAKLELMLADPIFTLPTLKQTLKVLSQ